MVRPLAGAEMRIQNHGRIAGDERGVARVERLERTAGRDGIARRHLRRAAAHEDPALLADEPHAVRELVPHPDGRSVGIRERDVVFAVDVPEATGVELALALDVLRAHPFPAHAPVDDVKVVRAPARDHARAELFAAEPARTGVDRLPEVGVLAVYAVFGVIDLRRGAEPEVVVKTLRHRHLLRVAAAGVAGKAHFDGLDLAETSLAHERARLLELDGRTLLRAEQELAVRLRDRGGEETPLADRERGGLLHVDVLAGERGLDRDLRVPVVGRGDRHDVDVRARDEVVEVARAHDGVGGGLVMTGHELLHPHEAAGVEVTRRDDPRALRAHEPGRIHRAPDATAADLRHVERVARRVRAQHGSGDNCGKRKSRTRGGRAADEVTSAGFHILSISLSWAHRRPANGRRDSAPCHRKQVYQIFRSSAYKNIGAPTI